MNGPVRIEETARFALCEVSSRGPRGETARVLGRRLGTIIPLTPNHFVSGPDGMRVIWYGPQRWWVHTPGPSWRLEGFSAAATFELSDSRRLLRVTGERIGAQLARHCPLDFASQALSPGRCARTRFGDAPLLLCRVSEVAVDLYLLRSDAEYVRTLLESP